jgi:hypothetical protein
VIPVRAWSGGLGCLAHRRRLLPVPEATRMAPAEALWSLTLAGDTALSLTNVVSYLEEDRHHERP